jgi:uncharacterized membrane protein
LENLSFSPILGPIVLTIVFAAALLMLFVGPSFANLSAKRRWTLSLLRFGVIALAFVATLRPGCIQKIEKSQSAVVLFLVDSTRSMELPHVSDNESRWKATVDMVRENQDRIQQLAENKIDVRFFSFDNRTEPIPIEDGQVMLPPQPTGVETDIGSAIYNLSLDLRDQRLLSMIIATDGVQNASDPEIELTQAVEALSDMETPLIAVQLGDPGDTGQLADVAITSFAEQQVVNKKNDLVAKATMVTRGYANQDVSVELVVTDSGGKESVVATEIYRPSNSYEETNVELKFRPIDPGEFRIKVRAQPMPGEVAIRNNELEGFLTVRDKGMRVLLMNGALGWEQKYLRDSLSVIDFIDLDFAPIYTNPGSRRNWPLKSFESEFADPEKYDVFILSNVDAEALYDLKTKTGPLRSLAKAVADGKGLLMIGGTHSFGAGLYHQTPLADVLPITMRATERQDYGKDVRKNLHINTPFKVRPTRDHYVTGIGEDGNNRAVWAMLPAMAGANRIVAKQTAEILLESDDDVRRPILAVNNVGGRVLAFAGDLSWQWRREGFVKEHDRFWRQVVLFLAFWDGKSDESVAIQLPKRRFSPKANLKFDVTVRNIAGETTQNVDFESYLVQPTGEKQLIAINSSGDRYGCLVDPDLMTLSGLYRIEVTANQEGRLIGTSEREFVVMDRDKEKSNPAANPEQMKRLASQTTEYGGKTIATNELAGILDEYINNPPMTKIEIPMKWQLGSSFPDALGFLLAFVGLLATEWLLRKKWGLV